jgi:hypothetical protein
MSEDVFILRANAPLAPEQPHYAIPGLKTELLDPIGRLSPTEASIASRTLEWIIPNTPHNKAWIARCYSHFKVLKLEEAQQMPVEKPPVKDEEEKPNDPEAPKEGAEDFFAVPGNPVEIKTLKSKIMGKLTELGIPVPKNSTLSTLQELLRASLK